MKADNLTVEPNLKDYEEFRSQFSWEKMRKELDGLPDNQGLNIAHEAVVRHAKGKHKNKVAIKWLGKKGEENDFTYKQLHLESIVLPTY